ncbi:autotransporter assembly complex protein TamA [Nitrincola iocasae]|uniref:Translocation and assembly module subunit TamA n=1 Tax=Nitrincola iocasae TaxID=2614693 RepID=A0A5J6LE67_9GAMM|nr:autotransporter assembly complex family protein [Nitrincola iocasae]QEW06733.1 outer membrane protein assembly factor [Nitrincola iocasae]
MEIFTIQSNRFSRRVRGLLYAGLLLGMTQAWSAELSLQIEGVSDELASNVKAYLSIGSLESQLITNESRLRYLHRQAEEEVRQSLQPFGYYNPTVISALEQLPSGDWLASYQVDAGVRTQLERVDIQITGEGATDPSFLALVENTPLQTGAPLRHPDYEDLKGRLQSVASERGYYRAVFERSRIVVDRLTNSAVVEITYATGPRTRISEIRFSDSPVSEDLLRRYLRFTEGDPVNVARLIDLQGALIDSNYFAEVQVLPLLDELEAGQIPIQVSLTPRPRNLYEAGIGFGTDTGARLQLGIERRYVNSRGHKMDARIRLSQVRNDLTGSYMIPGEDPRYDQYGLRSRYTDENSDTIESRTYAVGGIWQKQVGDWERVLSLDLEQEQYTFDQETLDQLLLIPRAQFNKTVADDRFNTRKGYNIDFGVAAASEALLSDVSLLQLTLSGKRVDPMGEKWRLLSRFDLGALTSSSFERVPASLRFYAGGDNSVRGYDYQELGPVSDQGSVVGGQYLMVGSLETDYMFRPDWRLAVFADAGNAFNDFNDSIKTSVGVGVRWQSPVGPIRLDLAKPISDSGFRIHFTLGPDL